MAPVIPVLLVMLILMLPVIGALLYLGVRGVNSSDVKLRGVKKILGILSLTIAGILMAVIAAGGYLLVNHESAEREPFIGSYKSVSNNNPEQIELTITASHFSITPNSFTECTNGTWAPILMDEGYIIQFSCAEGKHFSSYYLKGNELLPYHTGVDDLRFERSEPLND